jgi:hypothetical protein
LAAALFQLNDLCFCSEYYIVWYNLAAELKN